MRKNSTEAFVIPRVREYALTPVYWNTILHTSSLVEDNYDKTLNVEYNIFSSGRMRIIIPKQDWDTVGKFIADRLINKKGYFENIEEKTNAAKHVVLRFLSDIKTKNPHEHSFNSLVHAAETIYNLFMQYDAASVFSWFVAGDQLKQRIGEKLEITGENLNIVALPEEQTFATQMERDLIKAAFDKKAAPLISKTLSEKYYWIPFGYDGPTIWDETYFKARIQEYRARPDEIKTKCEEIQKRDKEQKQHNKKILGTKELGNSEKRLLQILHAATRWTDERKMLEFQLFFWYHRILSVLEQRYTIPVATLKYLFTHELQELDTHPQDLKKTAEQRMAQEFMTISKKGTLRIASKEEYQYVKELLRQQSTIDHIQGNVACRGTQTLYRAKVRILLSSKECSKIQPGEILAATMTTPDFVPAMNRALGFITDEGGVTCHAAIVAREMNKPCIIGTKNATQLLKDGDTVEMDVLKGSVKILE